MELEGLVARMLGDISKVQAQGSGKKWAEDNAKRLNALEGQVREQTNEAKEYTKNKCMEMDAKLAKLRDELDIHLPRMMADLEARIQNALPSLPATQRLDDVENRIKAIEQINMAAGPAPQAVAADIAENNFTARVNALEIFTKAQADAVSMQQVYLQGLHSSKPEEVQTLAACFAHIDQEIGRIKTKLPQVLDDAKRMVQSTAQEIKNEHGKALSDILGGGGPR